MKEHMPLTIDDLSSLTTSTIVCLFWICTSWGAGTGEARTPLKTESPERKETAMVENLMMAGR